MTSYNFGAIGLVKAFQMTGERQYLGRCRKFIEFWMDRQNLRPDRFGVPGTFYDQVKNANGKIVPFNYTSGPNKGGPGYDASDADGLFVAIAALKYYAITGDKEFLENTAGNSNSLVIRFLQRWIQMTTSHGAIRITKPST